MLTSISRLLRPVDFLIIVGLALLTIFFLVVSETLFHWLAFAAVNVSIAGSILLLSFNASRRQSRFLAIVFNFYPVAMILVVFKEVHVVLQTMARPDLDPLFIAIDRWLFGVDPTVWIAQFATPVITEILQISYFSYYFTMLAVGIELYRKREHERFSSAIFTIVYGFFLSYIGYMALPAVGPRFTLHEFALLDSELPGLFFSVPLRDIINAGESIPKGAANAIALAQRDVFPSGHTQMTLISLYFAWKYHLRSRHVLTFFGTLLIISTIYLRYHYVIDIIGGVAFMVITVWTAPMLTGWWEKQRR